MNTRHARLILAIVREGSFTAAAKALCITQPTLSQTVHQIEEQLGEPVFVRSRASVSLTPAGELYVQAARRMIQTETQLREAIGMLHGRAEGTLRIGLTEHRSDELLPQVLSDFWAAYPDMHLEVREQPVPRLEQMLLEGELDMALLSSETRNPKLEYLQVASEEIVLLAGRRTALAGRMPSGATIGLREAERERFVLPSADHPHRREYDALLLSCGVKPNVRMLCDSISTAKRCCMSAGLVMLAPFISLLCDSAAMQKLAHYHLGTDAYLQPFYMVHAKEQPLSPYARTLFSLLSSRYRAMTAYRP